MVLFSRSLDRRRDGAQRSRRADNRTSSGFSVCERSGQYLVSAPRLAIELKICSDVLKVSEGLHTNMFVE